MTMRISKVDDNTVAVQFQRLQGSKISFINFYNQYKQLIFNQYNDTQDKNQVETNYQPSIIESQWETSETSGIKCCILNLNLN